MMECKEKCRVLQEVRTCWLPTTCALTRNRMDYAQYGGGGNLVRALRGAVATDVRGWPSSVAGLGTGVLYWVSSEENKDPVEKLFACSAQCCLPRPGDGGRRAQRREARLRRH